MMKTGTGSGVMTAIASDRLELGAGHEVARATATRCWRHLREADGIEWLILDQTDASTNRIEPIMLEELDQLLAEVETNRPKGLVIRSAKRNGFVAGADIAQFRGVRDAAELTAVLRRGHAVFDRLAALRVPTVAVVHGFCLGGGLELALACRRRIAVPNASLGFPEIQLGLHPGLGGTARLTRLIDPLDAMTMMLTGRPKNARAALRAGLVDTVVDERHVMAAVRAALSGAVKPRGWRWRPTLLNLSPVRRFAGPRMRAEANKRARPDHYPAPEALIRLWEKHGGRFAAMKAAELPSFAALLVGDTAQNLVRIFFLRQAMSKTDKRPAVAHVHVIGAGAMGSDIAAWCAYRGFRVTLADTSLKALGGAMKRAGDLFRHHYRDRHDRAKLRDAFDRLIPDPRGLGVERADLIIEAVPENLDLKRKIFAAIEPRMKPAALLATNTSSIKIEDLCNGLARPDRLVGIHFFNPVARMPLVEVVSHKQATPENLSAARAFVAALDRVPAAVKSAPGFLVNRTLMPYLLEALLAFDEGAAAETIDHAAETFGMPMGPIELADYVGLDICLDVANVLAQNLTDPLPKTPDWLAAKVKRGELGRKTGKGIYDYNKDGKPQKRVGQKAPEPELTDRLILPLINACVACLREGVVTSEDIVDGALVFGAGFAPFRGGPLRYARMRGIADVTAALDRLAALYGERFKPDPGWQTLEA